MLTAEQSKLWRELNARAFHPSQWFYLEDTPLPEAEEAEHMWVYRKADGLNGGWDVGYYAPNGEWFSHGIYSTREKAALETRWLNGGHN